MELNVVGLMNIQYAICDDKVYVLEANPRASRTVPLVSKVCGISMARIATEIMLGKKLADLDLQAPERSRTTASRRPSSRSTCSPKWIPCWARRCAPPAKCWAWPTPSAWPSTRPRRRPSRAAHGGHRAAHRARDRDETACSRRPRSFAELGFKILATEGTHAFLAEHGIDVGADPEAARGPAQHRGRHQERRDPTGGQHAQRQAEQARRFLHPQGGHQSQGALHHDHRRGPGRGEGDRRWPRRRTRRPVAPGTPRCYGDRLLRGATPTFVRQSNVVPATAGQSLPDRSCILDVFQAVAVRAGA